MANEKIAVNDTIVDTDMTVEVLNEATKEVVGTGLVPPEELTSMYEDPTAKRKPFRFVIMKDADLVGEFMLHFKYDVTIKAEGETIAPVTAPPVSTGQVEESKVQAPAPSKPVS